MTLLVHPSRGVCEGPQAYRHRLGSENMLSLRQLTDVALVGDFDDGESLLARQVSRGLYIGRWFRYCPHCLEQGRSHRLGWEILFADACAVCGYWLLDTCSSCGASLTWMREDLRRCDCGHDLTTATTRAAPFAVVKLSQDIERLAMGQSAALSILRGMTLKQCLQLVRLLGSYGTWDGGRVPQKVLGADRLEVSWALVSYASEVVVNWPDGFNQLLSKLWRLAEGDASRKLPRAFGGLYAALYKGLRNEAFDGVRSAFEGYLATTWTGPLSRRNRRLSGDLISRAEWIPGGLACAQGGISRRRLMDLISQGLIDAHETVAVKGRRFLMVRRADLNALGDVPRDHLHLTAAARRLGFCKRRFAVLLPLICRDARKAGGDGCPWTIPTAWAETWELLLHAAFQSPCTSSQSTITLQHVLRYWAWTDEQIAQLLLDVHEGLLRPCARADEVHGVPGLVFEEETLRLWFDNRYVSKLAMLSIPEVATCLEVKQEVAYSVVRSGLLASVQVKVGRRLEHRVSHAHLVQFGVRFVWCRDLARKLSRSPKSVAAALDAIGIAPAAGPAVDGCRQLLYARDDVAQFLPQLKRTSRQSWR